MTRVVFVLLFILVSASNIFADATIPDKDLKDSKDSPLIGRFNGSYIVSYTTKSFDEITFPLSSLHPVKEKRDRKNNIVFEPENSLTLEGKRTRIIYVNPAEVSPLEVIRNYEQELEKNGGEILFSCKKNECGGSDTRSLSGGGGDMSLAMYFMSEEDIQDAPFSNGYCTQTSSITDQRFVVAELSEKHAYISVHTYTLQNTSFCKALNDRTIAVIDVLEVEKMQDKMVTIKAEEMAQEIASGGSVALYGIFFDFNKADIKPESTETLKQIAELLRSKPEMNLLVVGHTDNVGSYQANLDLSSRRAESVVNNLTNTYNIKTSRLMPIGVSYACPVAANTTDEGRAKNRRVELVQQ